MNDEHDGDADNDDADNDGVYPGCGGRTDFELGWFARLRILLWDGRCHLLCWLALSATRPAVFVRIAHFRTAHFRTALHNETIRAFVVMSKTRCDREAWTVAVNRQWKRLPAEVQEKHRWLYQKLIDSFGPTDNRTEE